MLKLQFKILSQAKLSSNQGFTLFEVLVAIIIALGFVATSLQAIVVATAFRVQAQQRQLATQLIQEEIENIKWIASNLDQVPGSSPPEYNVSVSKCTAATYNDGYASYLWAKYSTTDTTDPNYDATFNGAYRAIPNKTIAGNNRVGLRRIPLSTSSTAPHKTFRMQYEVRNYDGTNIDLTGDPIATDYIEITPNAALQCP